MKTKECNKKQKFMFPEFRDLVQPLREDNPHFAKLFEEHEALDQHITHLELDPVRLVNEDVETLKRKKLKLKYEIYHILKNTHEQQYIVSQSSC